MAAAWLWPLLLAATASMASAKCGVVDDKAMALQQLMRKTMLCNYDVDRGPSLSAANRTTVRHVFLRTQFDVDEASSSMTMVGYIMFIWKDEWLDAMTRGDGTANATRLYVDAEEIWTPSVALLESPAQVLGKDQALIINGTVYWTLLAPLRMPCEHDPSHWPYDKMVCTFTMVNLDPAVSRLENRRMLFNNIKWGNSHGWSLTGIKVPKSMAPMGFNNSVRLMFTLRRLVATQECTTVWPVALQPVLLAASIALPADSPHRPLLLCTMALVQVLLSAVVPTTITVVGDKAPGVVLLLRDLLLLTSAAILEWLWAHWLLSKASASSSASSALDGVLDLVDKLAVIRVLPGPGAPRAVRTVALVDRVAGLLLVVVCAVLMGRLLS